MQKAMVPISSVRFDEGQAFSPEAVPVLYEMGFLNDDSCTYTTQVMVCREEYRVEARQALRKTLDASDAERLISFLDANDWNVSFFVTWGDC